LVQRYAEVVEAPQRPTVGRSYQVAGAKPTSGCEARGLDVAYEEAGERR
jgi:hypothetical protein